MLVRFLRLNRAWETYLPLLVGEIVNFLREPEAGKPHIRFDERDVETEHGQTNEAPADERAGNR
jgi:hypothetical protein